jgi:hypothetical protein
MKENRSKLGKKKDFFIHIGEPKKSRRTELDYGWWTNSIITIQYTI